jgi:hypothetical protein
MTFCRQWLNKLAKLEFRRSEIARKDPKKAVRSADEELSALVHPDCWAMLEMRAEYNAQDLNRSKMNLFILEQIVEMVMSNSVDNVGSDPITYDRVKHLASNFNMSIVPHIAFTSLNASLKKWIQLSNQDIAADNYLMLLFSLLPEKYARYLLTMLANMKNRGFVRGPGQSPMDKFIILHDSTYTELVHDTFELGKLIFDQLVYISGVYKTHFDPDTFPGMHNVTQFPARNLNPLILHLYPVNNSVGAKKLGSAPMQNVRANVAASTTQEEVKNIVTPVSEKKRKFQNSSENNASVTKVRKCYNCLQPGHEARNCELTCRNAKCLGKPGQLTHAAKDCQLRQNNVK